MYKIFFLSIVYLTLRISVKTSLMPTMIQACPEEQFFVFVKICIYGMSLGAVSCDVVQQVLQFLPGTLQLSLRHVWKCSGRTTCENAGLP